VDWQAQRKKVRSELLAASTERWMARTRRAALMALHFFRRAFPAPWTPQRLEPWEGPFADPNQRGRADHGEHGTIFNVTNLLLRLGTFQEQFLNLAAGWNNRKETSR